MAETFFATLKKELVYRRPWPTRQELISEIFEYIEAFYNPRRRHSTWATSHPASSRKALAARRSRTPRSNNNINTNNYAVTRKRSTVH